MSNEVSRSASIRPEMAEAAKAMDAWIEESQKRYFICSNSHCDNEVMTTDGREATCCAGCDNPFIECFECKACSKAGGADRAVRHAMPMCSIDNIR